jgi:primosomal protein N'
MEETVMSEATTATTTAPAAVAPVTEPAPQGDPALGEGGEKALKAERARANALEKQVKDAQAKLDAIEAAKLSDLEKAQKAANDAATQLAEFQKTTLRQQVALEKGVPAKWVDRLKGDTQAELEADADAILADIKPDSTTPKPDLSQGPRGGAGGSAPADQFAAFLKNQL